MTQLKEVFNTNGSILAITGFTWTSWHHTEMNHSKRNCLADDQAALSSSSSSASFRSQLKCHLQGRAGTSTNMQAGFLELKI